MKKLLLLIAAGSLWLFLAVAPAFADGGPHVAQDNAGTGSTLAGDCAACHRVHTGQNDMLLKAAVPGLCTNCHNGAGATTDVVDGVQVKVKNAGTGAGNILGALRGGGFTNARIDTHDPNRLFTARRAVVTFLTGTTATNPTAGSFTITVTSTAGTYVTGALNMTTNWNAADIQTALQAVVPDDSTYVTACADGKTANGGVDVCTATSAKSVTVDSFGTGTFRLNWANTIITKNPVVTIQMTGMSPLTNTVVASVTRYGSIGVLASGEATTSTHSMDGSTQTVWGSGSSATGVGATGAKLNCASCHNPHGNGQYRILNTDPGENMGGTFTAFAYPIDVPDVGVTTSTKNYTVTPGGPQASDVKATALADYWRKQWDPTGVSNWTNIYLLTDRDGFDGKLPVAGSQPAARQALNAWCITCHSRYNTASSSSAGVVVAPFGGTGSRVNTGDPVFMYRHTTTSADKGCVQCHVSHGSNAVMGVGTASADVTWPTSPMSTGNTPGTGNADSRLLKVDNRGQCQFCHEPTGTAVAGDFNGTIPASPVNP